MPYRLSLRWVVILVYMLASALAYLDRMVLAALAPDLLKEFRLSGTDYGFLLSAFSIFYAAEAPLAGLFLDRVGLRRGMAISVSLWSLASASRGLVGGFRELLGAMAALGIAESAVIPGSGKASAVYLRPEERAFGAAVNQIGLSLGGMAAPVLAGVVSVAYGWRATFLVTGILGFLWLPLWLLAVRKAPAVEMSSRASSVRISSMLQDRTFWGLIAANTLVMTGYSLWTNWTPLYLVQAHGLTPAEANLRYVWIPPIFAGAGGLIGAFLAFRLMRSGMEVHAARMRICRASGLLLLLAVLIPVAPGPGLATAMICLSSFGLLCFSVNLYSMPLDFYGAGRAGFGVAALTFAYGLMQTVYSPVVGRMVDSQGYALVWVTAAILPLAGYVVLRGTQPRR